MNSQQMTALEQIYVELGIEKYDRLLPARRHAIRPAFSTVLTSTVCRPYFLDFDAVYSFDSVLYLSLVSLLVYFEGVGTFDICKVHPLLGNQRPNYDIVVIHVNTRHFHSPGLYPRQTKELL